MKCPCCGRFGREVDQTGRCICTHCGGYFYPRTIIKGGQVTLAYPPPLHRHHDWNSARGESYGKVYILRRGVIPRDKSGRPILFDPSSVTRGDIILDLQLHPLRKPRKGLHNAR